MSGHSKWATIHRQKEIKDAKKGAIFTKLGQAITVAARSGGGFRLSLAVEKARQFNMPKDNIARAIERGEGEGEGLAVYDMVFEGFGPGGVAVMVEAVTDNKLRTGQKVREIFDKNGGSLGQTGSVAYLFEQIGQVVVNSLGRPVEKIVLAAIDCGAQDVEEEGEQVWVSCKKEETVKVRQCLESQGISVASADLVMKPRVLQQVADKQTQERVENLLEKLEAADDILKVWTNYA